MLCQAHLGFARVIVTSHHLIGASEHAQGLGAFVLLLIQVPHGEEIVVVLRCIGIAAHGLEE